MILHTDRYFEHRYDVKLDMLCVKWPTIESLYLPEILHSVNTLVENVVNYNIRNLLIDASNTQMLATNEEADKVVHLFINGLAKSRLEKLARIESANFEREMLMKKLLADMNEKYNYETRFFKDFASAYEWLASGHAPIKSR